MHLLWTIIPMLFTASAAPADRSFPDTHRDGNLVLSHDGTADDINPSNLESWRSVVENDGHKRDYLNMKETDEAPTPTITAFMAGDPANTGLVKRTTKACKPKTTSKPSCSMKDADPDEGLNSAQCICNGVTLPLLTPTHVTMVTQSCDYTAIPTSGHITTTPHLGPATTDTKHCQVCTPVVNNEDECTSIKNCVVQTGAVTVQAGSSSVHVGTMTGSALYTGISKALESLCPSVTQTTSMTGCETGTAKIKNVPYVNAGFLAEGTIDVKVEASQYNVTSLRDAMIRSAALTAMNAASGKNCYKVDYDTEEYRKRDDTSRWAKWLPSFVKRGDIMPPDRHTDVTFCNTVGFAGVNYYNPWWREHDAGASDYLDVNYSFDSNGGGAFACEMLEAMVDSLAIVAPEFAVGDIELGEAIDVICEKAEGL
ncbi:uncharacterized protein N7482_003758 [Penicillium canariense]|uniref:Uncharacterized protein n=1 Tax=Penicillium canariense TaxID=189055 RepID=A0A9W9I546_9EURO|nr:uncharacterized protein N7482_003758 [Penicillium canariense]KAJ5168164.1 hypothetical protein N7482_003758 [Penicillium canariense]